VAKKKPQIGLGEAQKRRAEMAQQKALEEDPTIYQYDELYEEMDTKRKEAKLEKKNVERKPKYINKLLETADKRKKEHERRIERQVQKERDAEGEMFKDKESFVTSAYRKKLEEMKKAEEEEKREEYLESIGDVTKQGNLDGFYRHIYAQKTDADNQPPPKPEVELEKSEPKPKAERKYRRHKSADDDEEEVDQAKDRKSDAEAQKVHLQSNLDADSDFSIDSDSESESEKSDKQELVTKIKVEPEDDVKPAVESLKTETTVSVKTEEAVDEKPLLPPSPKKPKIDIWKKRTVGEVYEDAVRRYYERKSARESGL
jgi:coiled-coil domain-containing protein 55